MATGLFESVPNFSEGRRGDVIDAIAAAAGMAYVLDTDPDRDHNRVVVSLAGSRATVVDGLLAAIGVATEQIDLRAHSGVHPRVGAADVVPIVPLGGTTLDECRQVAHAVGERVWSELKVPVYFYGHGESHSLADIRAGRARPDLGGPDLHPKAGAVCVGARRMRTAASWRAGWRAPPRPPARCAAASAATMSASRWGRVLPARRPSWRGFQPARMRSLPGRNGRRP